VELHNLLGVLGHRGSETFVGNVCQDGGAADLRLVAPLLKALAGRHEDVADLVAEEGLPAFGPALVSDLQAGLEHQEPTVAARYLLVLCRVDPASGREQVCRRAPELRAHLRCASAACGSAGAG
jgi:hypothetical protein